MSEFLETEHILQVVPGNTAERILADHACDDDSKSRCGVHLEQANGAWHGVQNHTAIRYSPAGCSILAKVVICHNLYRVTVSSSLMNPWNPSSVGKRLANRLLSMTLLSSLAVSVRGTTALAATRNEANSLYHFDGGRVVRWRAPVDAVPFNEGTYRSRRTKVEG